MKTTTMRSKLLAPLRGKALAAVIASSALCGFAGISMMPAHAEGNDKRDEHYDKHHDKDRLENRRHDDHGRRGHEEPRFYPQPVYAPPAVYYPPPESPGISIFLPLDVRIR
jgi:ABC-type Zn2+ transport system substrate-binding protein/surface adhesin